MTEITLIRFWVTHSAYIPIWESMRVSPLASRGSTQERDTPKWVEPTSEDWFDDSSCAMHDWKDVLTWSALWEGDSPDHSYTNQELYQSLHPDNIRNPYLYEDIEFSHCR